MVPSLRWIRLPAACRGNTAWPMTQNTAWYTPPKSTIVTAVKAMACLISLNMINPESPGQA